MSDRSFVRFGGLAAILIAVTSVLETAAYYTLARQGQDEVGLEMVALLAALAAFWSLFAVVAVYWTLRVHGEAWSFFAVLVGIAAAIGSMTSALYPVAFTRVVLGRPLDVTAAFPVAVASTDPLNVMSLGLLGLWFVVIAIILWRSRRSRRTAAVGAAAGAVMLFGFFASLGAQDAVLPTVIVIAGAVLAPLFWLGMASLLRRAA